MKSNKQTKVAEKSESHIIRTINLILLIISIIVGIIIKKKSPFFNDYRSGVLCIIFLLTIFYFIGVNTIKKLKSNKNTKKRILKYIAAVVTIIISSPMILIFSYQTCTTIYNTVEYARGDIRSDKFVIRAMRLGDGNYSDRIDGVKAESLNTGEVVKFDCDLPIGSLVNGKAYYIKYIPHTNRLLVADEYEVSKSR